MHLSALDAGGLAAVVISLRLAWVQGIVSNILQNNDPPMSPEQVRGFPSFDAANAWLLANTETAPAGLHFVVTGDAQIDFTLQLNTTTKWFRRKNQDPLDLQGLPLQIAAHREIIRCVRVCRCKMRRTAGSSGTGAFVFAAR